MINVEGYLRNIFNKTNILLMVIIFLAAILRFCCLDKSGGLWYDEMVSYKEASQPNLLYVILYTLKTDVHLPLYSIFLHFWSKLFSFSDYSLRAFSAICGIITVLVSYFVGKELKSKETGLCCSLIFAINSFLIFYSQEIRNYSFLVLMSIMFLLFLLKIKNRPNNKWNYVGLVMFALFTINTYTIAFIFVFAQILALILYFSFQKSEGKTQILRHILMSTGTLVILSSPVLLYLYFNKAQYTGQINGYYCDWSSMFVLLQNWFTPVLEGLYNNPIHYMNTIFSNFSLYTLIFIFVPIIVSIFCIAYSVKKDKFSYVILGGAMFLLLSEIIAFKFTNFKILSRYTAIIMPNLLVLLGYGFSLIDYKKWGKLAFIILFATINLFYLLAMPNSAFRMPRAGFSPLAQMLNSLEIDKDDYVVVWNRPEILDKYIDRKVNKISLLRNFAYTSEVILGNESKLNKLSLDDRKKVLHPYFSSDYVPQNTDYLMDRISKHLKPGQKFIITTSADFDKLTQVQFTNLVKDEKEFKKISFNDLLTIKALIDVKQLSYKKLHFIKKIEDEQFVVRMFEKS